MKSGLRAKHYQKKRKNDAEKRKEKAWPEGDALTAKETERQNNYHHFRTNSLLTKKFLVLVDAPEIQKQIQKHKHYNKVLMS